MFSVSKQKTINQNSVTKIKKGLNSWSKLERWGHEFLQLQKKKKN